MITIKKKHNINNNILDKLIKDYSSVIRYTFNRAYKDNITSLSDLEKLVKCKMDNIDLDASFIKCAVKEGLEIYQKHKLKEDKSDKKMKLYFGGKKNFFNLKFNKTNSYDKYNKDMYVAMRGSKSDKGNRKAKLDLDNDRLIFKPFKGTEIEFDIKLSKRQKQQLNVIQERSLLRQDYFNIKISSSYIYISFNPVILEKHIYKEERVLGIDLNPNYIAISILDPSLKEVYKEIIDIKRLVKMYNKNKQKYELSVINKYIVKLCQYYQVEYVSIEDISISSGNKGKGKVLNRLLNNGWNRTYYVNNLIKNLKIYDIKYRLVNPFYTSFMGQLKFPSDFDSIAASKEVAIRCLMEIYNINMYEYVQEWLDEDLPTQWKEMINLNIKSKRDMYLYFKNQKSKSSYRYLFNDKIKDSLFVCSLKSDKSKVDLVKLSLN